MNPSVQHLRASLANRLKHNLPGPSIWKKWNAEYAQAPRSAKPAGVLICLYPKEDRIYLPVMQRPKDTGPHSGQISLPGGAFEHDQDKNLTDTALREANEEMGIEKQKVSLIGKLTSLYIPVSEYLVQPVVGIVSEPPLFRPDPFEVEQIIELPIEDLLRDEVKTTYTFQYNGKTLQSLAFQFGQYNIWGATAMILSEFSQVLQESIDKA